MIPAMLVIRIAKIATVIDQATRNSHTIAGTTRIRENCKCIIATIQSPPALSSKPSSHAENGNGKTERWFNDAISYSTQTNTIPLFISYILIEETKEVYISEEAIYRECSGVVCSG